MKSRVDRRTFVRSGGAALAWALAGPAGARARQRQAAGLSDAFLARLGERMKADSVPGASIAVIRGGEVVWTRGVGVRDTKTAAPMTDETILFAASLSKPVFAYAVLRLVDEKRIDLDRPLVEYVRPADLPDDPRTSRVTARHVLSHTSGWQNWRFQKSDALAFASAPGERFRYSGEGIFYLQRVVEHVTKRPLAELMRSLVLEPFGMASSSYAWSPRMVGRYASYYREGGRPQAVDLGPALNDYAVEWRKPLDEWRTEDVARVITPVTEKTWPDVKGGFPALPAFFDPNAAGSLRTTAGDYARFMVRVMERPKRSRDEIAEPTRREMLEPQVRIDDALAWGLGWGLERAGGREYFWHWGEHFAYRTFAIGDAKEGSGVVVLTNGGGGAGVSAAVVEEAMGAGHPSLVWIARG